MRRILEKEIKFFIPGQNEYMKLELNLQIWRGDLGEGEAVRLKDLAGNDPQVIELGGFEGFGVCGNIEAKIEAFNDSSEIRCYVCDVPPSIDKIKGIVRAQVLEAIEGIKEIEFIEGQIQELQQRITTIEEIIKNPNPEKVVAFHEEMEVKDEKVA